MQLRARLGVILFSLTGLLPGLASAQTTLTIEEAIALALSQNERSTIAAEQIAAADARVARARAFFFPSVQASSSYDVSGDGDNDGASADVNLSQTIFSARSFPLYRYARLLRESTIFIAKNQRRVLAFDTAEAFLVTLGQQSVVSAAERRRQFARTSVDDAGARFDAGLVSSNDVTRSQLELSSAEIAYQRAANSLLDARLQLANLIAAEVGTLAEPERLLIDAATETPDVAANLDRSIERRPDIAALRRNARALDEFAKEPSRRFIPSVSADGRYRASEGSSSNADDDATASINVNWDIFDGGERAAERAEREAQARIARLTVAAAERTANTELQTAAADVLTERTNISHAEDAANAARKNAEETGELYRQGLATSLELADANVRRFEAEINESRARYQLALAFLSWRDVLGLGPAGKEME